MKGFFKFISVFLIIIECFLCSVKATGNIFTIKTQTGNKIVQENDTITLDTEKGHILGTIVYICGYDSEHAIYIVDISQGRGYGDDLIDIPANETENVVVK